MNIDSMPREEGREWALPDRRKPIRAAQLTGRHVCEMGWRAFLREQAIAGDMEADVLLRYSTRSCVTPSSHRNYVRRVSLPEERRAYLLSVIDQFAELRDAPATGSGYHDSEVWQDLGEGNFMRKKHLDD